METQNAASKVIDGYIDALPYRNESHSPLLILFSAVPGSGKTTLARKLTEDLHAQYVQADEIRRMLERHGVDPMTQKISDIAGKIVRRIIKSDHNKCIILDASIDRTWPKFFERARELNMPTFIIRLEISPDEVKRRLIERDGSAGTDVKREKFRADFDECKQQVKADVEIGAVFDYRAVLAAIRQKLASASK